MNIRECNVFVLNYVPCVLLPRNDVIVTSLGLCGVKNATFGHLNRHTIRKNALIKLRIDKKVVFILFLKNQLHNGDLHCQMDPRSARNVHFLVKKWCSKMEPF